MLHQSLLDPPSPRLKDGNFSVLRAGEEVPLVVELEGVQGSVGVGQRSVLGSFTEIENLDG